MSAQSFSPVLPVPDLPGAVAFWSQLLGVEPTFVDGDRWAQFDVDGRRLALAGTDRFADEPGLMVKVDDVEDARGALAGAGAGAEVGPVQDGAHERRCTVTAPGGWSVVLYSPLRPAE
jgi:catechol 2,3-dioxygenase-like lactoylglutathione lyase family enzyme